MEHFFSFIAALHPKIKRRGLQRTSLHPKVLTVQKHIQRVRQTGSISQKGSIGTANYMIPE